MMIEDYLLRVVKIIGRSLTDSERSQIENLIDDIRIDALDDHERDRYWESYH